MEIPTLNCKNCPNRKTGSKDCHSKCSSYLAWKQYKHQIRLKLIQEQKEIDFQNFLRSQRTPPKSLRMKIKRGR